MKNKILDFFGKHKKWIVIISIVGLLIGVFTINTSNTKTAIKELKKTQNKEQVVTCWNKWISKINSQNGKVKFTKNIKGKLADMRLSDREISDWHQKFKMNDVEEQPSLNIIIIPDLSNRINEIPNTKARDIEIISKIYDIFFERAKTGKTKDKLLIEVTDKFQGNGVFRQIADSLSIDIADRNNEQARKFLRNKEESFKNNLKRLYEEASQDTSGADFILYFRRTINDRIKKSDIYNEFENKIIILTDGYIEIQNQNQPLINYTPHSIKMKNDVLTGQIREKLRESNNLKFPTTSAELNSNTDILVLEINERKDGIGWHKELLEEYWRYWFSMMKVRNLTENENTDFFKDSNNSINQIKGFIEDFL